MENKTYKCGRCEYENKKLKRNFRVMTITSCHDDEVVSKLLCNLCAARIVSEAQPRPSRKVAVPVKDEEDNTILTLGDGTRVVWGGEGR